MKALLLQRTSQQGEIELPPESTKLKSKGLVKKYRGGWAGAFGNVVDKKHMTHPLPSAQK